MAQFLVQPEQFIARTPLMVDKTFDVLSGHIRLLDKNNGLPNDNVPAAPTTANHTNLTVLRDNQRHLRVTQHGGLQRASNFTFVHFQISDTHSGYGETVAGVDFLLPSGGGTRAFYLPFKANKISSIQLGNEANFFFTDSLSGCSVFVDYPGGASGPRVFHANGRDLGRTQQAIDYMEGLHFHHDYPTARAPSIAEKFDWTHYFTTTPNEVVAPLIARKVGGAPSHGWRSNVQGNVVGAAVFGFRNPTNNTWSFYYQVVANLSYDRPDFSPSRHLQGKHVAHKFYVADSGPLPEGP